MINEERYLFCNAQSSLRSVPMYHLERAIQRTALSHGKKLNPEDDLDAAVDEIYQDQLDEFCWSLYFEPSFLVRLFYSGFLPISVDLGARDDPVYCLLPKLHRERCVVIPPNHVHISSKVKKKSRKYSFSMDACFDRVLQSCIDQHGSRGWLYRPLRNALADLHNRPCPVVHSVELWDNDSGELVAGEIGYHVGAIYTSMTGFFEASGSGTIQLVALAMALAQKNVSVWDLGMSMDYKLELGARNIDRREWISTVRQHRNDPVNWGPIERINVKQLIG